MVVQINSWQICKHIFDQYLYSIFQELTKFHDFATRTVDVSVSTPVAPLDGTAVSVGSIYWDTLTVHFTVWFKRHTLYLRIRRLSISQRERESVPA